MLFEYFSLIRSLMYATYCTKPDIAFSACKFSRYTSNPNTEYLRAIVMFFGYQNRTIELELFNNNFCLVLEG